MKSEIWYVFSKTEDGEPVYAVINREISGYNKNVTALVKITDLNKLRMFNTLENTFGTRFGLIKSFWDTVTTPEKVELLGEYHSGSRSGYRTFVVVKLDNSDLYLVEDKALNLPDSEKKEGYVTFYDILGKRIIGPKYSVPYKGYLESESLWNKDYRNLRALFSVYTDESLCPSMTLCEGDNYSQIMIRHSGDYNNAMWSLNIQLSAFRETLKWLGKSEIYDVKEMVTSFVNMHGSESCALLRMLDGSYRLSVAPHSYQPVDLKASEDFRLGRYVEV